jgi:nitrogen regulatory protein P-II 2
MKLIIAIIRPEKLAAVQAALTELKACLISVSQVLGGGREPGRTGMYRGVEFRVQPPKLRLEIAADDWLVEGAVEAIMRAESTGHSGQIGDCGLPRNLHTFHGRRGITWRSWAASLPRSDWTGPLPLPARQARGSRSWA